MVLPLQTSASMLLTAETPPSPVPLPSLRLVRQARVRSRQDGVMDAIAAIVCGAIIMFVSFIVGIGLSLTVLQP